MTKAKITSHGDLEVYQIAFQAALDVFEASRTFPKAETYSLTDQIRRSSRAVCSNIAEAWRRRRYEGACGYLDRTPGRELYAAYDNNLGKLVTMIRRPEQWTIGG